jgi:hypothetical protein
MVQALKKKKIFVVSVLCLVCFSLGRFASPAKIETKEVEKIVYKERVTQDRRTVTRETKRPDGTVIKERDTQVRTDRNTDASSETSKETKTTNRPDWRLSGGYIPAVPGFQEPRFQVGLEHQILSDLYAGLYVTSDRNIGLSISIGF